MKGQSLRYGFVLVILFELMARFASGQYPPYFMYDDEAGLPSNEVYSIVQDRQGFIWIGCDAGLYKFDGIKYIPYKSVTQKSKAVTGLCFSASGRLYCYNFQSQLFFVQNNSLQEIKGTCPDISNMVTDNSGNVFVNHSLGLSVFNERTGQWKIHNGFGEENPFGNRLYTKSAKFSSTNQVYFLNTSGLGIIKNGQLSLVRSKIFLQEPPGNFIMECVGNEAWIFSVNKNLVYHFKNGSIQPLKSPALLKAIANRKITNVKWLSDGKLWICTYTGIIRYDIEKDFAENFYPAYSFSDVFIDREANYWMSTLQAGVLRVADLRQKVWNGKSENMPGEKLSRLVVNGSDVFFATVNGYIGHLNRNTGQINAFHTGNYADVQGLFFDGNKGELYFSINNDMFVLQNKQVKLFQSNVPPVKNILKDSNQFYLSTSFGTYVLNEKGKQCISQVWSRNLVYDHEKNKLWAATNKGLFCFERETNGWSCTDTLLNGTQVLDIAYDTIQRVMCALSFDGKIYAIDGTHDIMQVTSLPNVAQAYRFKWQHDFLYVATNKGLYIYNLRQKKWKQLDRHAGLVSDNVQDLQVINDEVWLATGKGLQVVPISEAKKNVPALIQLKKIGVNNKTLKDTVNIWLRYGEALELQPEVSAYNSNGKFQYAYRLKNSSDRWTFLPGNTTVISIPNIPSGDFSLELKAVDHLGRNSENTITVSGYVHPPFWKSAWFLIACCLFIIIIAMIVFRQRIRTLRKKQSREIERLNLENELRLTQQTAIKAQMNPHFIFNVLNSIKGYIYNNDKQKASEYLSSFSDLVRNILDRSSLSYTTVADELKMLKLYVELESMMLGENFSYEVVVEDDVDQLQIPSMIIQPYVENAFKHGLRHRQGDKKLGLKVFLLNDSILEIQVTDNGIGREASRALNEQNRPGHKSFATGAMEHRLALINREGNREVTVVTHDLLNGQGEVSGTNVILTIQFK